MEISSVFLSAVRSTMAGIWNVDVGVLGIRVTNKRDGHGSD